MTATPSHDKDILNWHHFSASCHEILQHNPDSEFCCFSRKAVQVENATLRSMPGGKSCTVDSLTVYTDSFC